MRRGDTLVGVLQIATLRPKVDVGSAKQRAKLALLVVSGATQKIVSCPASRSSPPRPPTRSSSCGSATSSSRSCRSKGEGLKPEQMLKDILDFQSGTHRPPPHPQPGATRVVAGGCEARRLLTPNRCDRARIRQNRNGSRHQSGRCGRRRAPAGRGSPSESPTCRRRGCSAPRSTTYPGAQPAGRGSTIRDSRVGVVDRLALVLLPVEFAEAADVRP